MGGLKGVKSQQQTCCTRSSSTSVNEIDISHTNISPFSVIRGRGEEEGWEEEREKNDFIESN